MSSDFYFIKWKQLLIRLEELVNLDLEYQKTKAHDKKRCQAVIRLCGILGEYMVLYKDATECWHQNLQVQKTAYIEDIVNAITKRIIELKHEIRKLECSDTHFLSHGLANHKLTTFDVEMNDVLTRHERPPHVKAAVADAFKKAEERRELIRIEEEKEKAEEMDVKEHNWWDDDTPEGSESSVQIEEKEPETEEIMQTRVMVSLIQAHERSRQVIIWQTYKNQRREMWEKELKGTLQPPARLELRERSAKLIQKTIRVYFEIKRKKIEQCQRDQILGIRLCKKMTTTEINTDTEMKKVRSNQRKEFEQQWIQFREKLKKDFKNRKGEEITDDYRDLVNAWFRKWFDDIKYFYDVPTEDSGGISLIMKEETPEPIEWWETYQTYLEEKKANKNKSGLQLKYEQIAVKEEQLAKKREELIKKRIQEKLMQKLMKNPTMHPGFHYPKSKQADLILEMIQQYHRDWDDLDNLQCLEVKKRFVPSIDMNEIYAEVKMELMQVINEDMRMELKILKKALKEDYANNEMTYPEHMKKPRKRVKRKKRVKVKMSEGIADKLEELAFKEILKEYPRTVLGDFLGDHNFAGDDFRCNYKLAPHFSGETKIFWWERCREATHGFHKIMVVGPRLSGKTILVHALANVIDAVLFELDLYNLEHQSSSTADLQPLFNSIATCAKATQPSVIYIKHVHRLYYKKVPSEEANMNLDIIRRLLSKMLKKINKTDRITVVGTCVDPWLTKSSKLLKQFPAVLLVPDTSYSAIFQLLSNWIVENRCLPSDLDIHSLAHILRGYSYGFLKRTLREFLSADQIVKIAAYGLTPTAIHDYILQRDMTKVDYEKYLKWYTEKTPWGIKEAKHFAKQLEFKHLVDKFAEKTEKAKAKQVPVTSDTSISSATEGGSDE